ncbi:nicotinate-nucleotide--dimethylbenzimidazole phosphoribosyltransferase [Colwellia sp. D2M02]|uniref:nicotinate-nucleotide--dimethylbenzimidazole phosphoribosyltransferase n=1 Tax=Colwellia sp. D2M02 TaxID=2841562 RepID=UPI001C086F9B|nr:nicotinate-nucleotide--dimethylbenzimidazole phosphoribosyltransferase [Colwellia sp. D2M02]MBU2892164.1 nicotinate-nucleotide--dimethylbenzimidazole phosphoribosyltransferase [Colwellia sp. D2M02]
MYAIPAVNRSQLSATQAKIDGKTKPVGALGELETLAKQLMLIQWQRMTVNEGHSDLGFSLKTKLSLTKPMMLVFAGDHGINEAQVSIAPSAVTRQMVLNFLSEGAAINCFCRNNDIGMTVIDCGVLDAISDKDKAEYVENNVNFVVQRLGAGTHNIANQAAMSLRQVEQGLSYGEKVVTQQLALGCDVILLGEMGIANTSSASALMLALTSYSVDDCVGMGTGITELQLAQKKRLITQALARINTLNNPSLDGVEEVDNTVYIKTLLSELGGFEIVQMVGAILAAAKASVAVVVDGFIVSVAALVAVKINANVVDYLIFSHVSQEKAHQGLLNEFKQDSRYHTKSLLSLGLRLGEGSGAALAYPLLTAAASFYNNMASFEDAGVTV